MLSQEEFSKRVLDSFDNIRMEIGKLREEVGKIHDCQTRLESQFQTHLKVEEALDLQKEKDLNAETLKQAGVDRKFYIVIAVVTTILGTVATYAALK